MTKASHKKKAAKARKEKEKLLLAEKVKDQVFLGEEPDITFQVENSLCSKNDFRNLTTYLRLRFGEHSRAYPPFYTLKENTKKFTVAQVSYGSSKLYLAIRASDVYVIAFRGLEVNWVELIDTQNLDRTIKGSNMLDIECSYSGLLPNNPCRVTRDNLKDGVDYLSTVTYRELTRKDTAEEARKRVCEYLTLIIFAISESVRFHPIAAEIGSSLQKNHGTIQGWMIDLAKHWSTLSTLARKYHGQPMEFEIPELKQNEHLQFVDRTYQKGQELATERPILTIADLLIVLGMLARKKEAEDNPGLKKNRD